jgi:L-lactate permease
MRSSLIRPVIFLIALILVARVVWTLLGPLLPDLVAGAIILAILLYFLDGQHSGGGLRRR